MAFNSLAFLIFLPTVVFVYWRLNQKAQNYWLLAASLLFYGWWRIDFFFLFLAATLANYFFALLIDRLKRQVLRRVVLAVAVMGNLGLLGYFKYAGFFIENVSELLRSIGWRPIPLMLAITLPIGISFYTFQLMAYVIDVYRRSIKAETSLAMSVLFISFFPQLVAGPILRINDLMPALKKQRIFKARRFWNGADYVVWGLIKKVVVADNVGYFVDQIFGLNNPSTLLILIATVGFGIQIFCDFSAYSDIARGSSKLLGIEIPLNFKRPYLAKSITQFWRRWHVTLSFWIRDYLYVPLGGSSGPVWRRNAALMVTWMLCGLWHGAAWKYVAWGIYHGFLILRERNQSSKQNQRGIFQTVSLVFLGWLIFRTPSLTHIGGYFSATAWFGSINDIYVGYLILVSMLFYSLPLILKALWDRSGLEGRPSRHSVRLAVYTLSTLAIWLTLNLHETSFIYFQF